MTEAMIQRYQVLTGVGLVVTALIAGGTALADSQSPDFTVTGLAIQSVKTSNGQTTLDVAITVYDTGNQTGSWEFPNPTLAGGNPNALPTIDITDQHTGFTVESNSTALVSSPGLTITGGQSATAVYAFQFPTPPSSGDSFSITLVDQPSKTDNVFHMYQSSGSTAPVTDPPPPVGVIGQLPEVPWAAGLPMVGVGAAALLWARRRRDNKAAI